MTSLGLTFTMGGDNYGQDSTLVLGSKDLFPKMTHISDLFVGRCGSLMLKKFWMIMYDSSLLSS